VLARDGDGDGGGGGGGGDGGDGVGRKNTRREEVIEENGEGKLRVLVCR
jgi:hypothetical protein